VSRAQSADLKHYGHITINNGTYYTAGEDWNFNWLPDELKAFKQLWVDNQHIDVMTRYLQRTEEEIAVLIMDLGCKGIIKPRPGGVFGGWKANG